MRSIQGKLTEELLNHTTPKSVGTDTGFPVKSFRELVEQVAKLSFLNKDYLLFFRGQKSDYKNKANSSTFYPTIYRGEYLTQAELDFRFDKLESARKVLIDILTTRKIEGFNEIKRKKLIQWSLLQHYEVTDTPLIDVTQSLRVACSFAQLDNKEDSAFIYVFGLPYFTNRISINSEHDLINIRLLSISPPHALRPYFQEGYLVGTDDITNDYAYKNELDLNNRLIAKFEIPNNAQFWGADFDRIPVSALYPKNDIIEDICKEIAKELIVDAGFNTIGEFLKVWTQLEQKLLNKAQTFNRNVFTVRDAIIILMENEQNNYDILRESDFMRVFRNKLVHNPSGISSKELRKNIEILKDLFKLFK